MPCDEAKRARVLAQHPEFQRITAIPETAFLVVGSTPGEARRGRTFYDDSAYYLSDIWEIEGQDYSRFLKCDYKRIMDYKHTGDAFCEKFDIVICDYSVFHFFAGRWDAMLTLDSLFNMVKPGGSLILDNAGVVLLTPERTLQEEVESETAIRATKLRERGFNVEVPKCIDLIKTNPVANDVYGPLLERGFMKEYDTCFVIQKPAVGGKRKKLISRKKKNRTQKTRRIVKRS
jgi:hypothetical protein